MNEDIRLLIYSPLSMRMGAGGDRWLSEVVPKFRGHGIEPSIIATDFIPKGYQSITNTWYLDQILNQNIKYQEIPVFFPNSAKAPILKPKSFQSLYSEFAKHDVIYFMNAYIMQDVCVWLAKKIANNIPIISSQHATIWHEGIIHNLYINSVSRHFLKYFDAHHVLNAADYETYKDWNIPNVHLVPNGVNITEFKQSKRDKSDNFTILFVGRLGHQKGVQTLLDAIKILELRGSSSAIEITFEICGTGPLKNIVDDFALHRSNFRSHGYVSELELHSFYERSSLFVMPSLRETFGLVALEAMASGLPLIVTNISGPRSFVNTSFAKIIPPGNPQFLADAIDWYYDLWTKNPSEFKKMSTNARKTSEQKHDWAPVVEQLSKIVRGVLSPDF